MARRKLPLSLECGSMAFRKYNLKLARLRKIFQLLILGRVDGPLVVAVGAETKHSVIVAQATRVVGYGSRHVRRHRNPANWHIFA